MSQNKTDSEVMEIYVYVEMAVAKHWNLNARSKKIW